MAWKNLAGDPVVVKHSSLSVDDAAMGNRIVVRGLRRQKRGGRGFRIAFDRCDSPIEQQFCIALFQLGCVRAVAGNCTYRHIQSAEPGSILVYAQQPIKQFRTDFLLVGVEAERAEPRFLIVECDGVEYHATPDRRAYDDIRQQALVATGFRIIRHTGAAIYANPHRVIDRTIRALGWQPGDWSWINNETMQQAFDELRTMAEMEMRQETTPPVTTTTEME